MIQLRKDTDQALLLLSHLLRQDVGDFVSAATLASSLKLPYPTVSKILKLLHKNEILTSVQGAAGGYAVAPGCAQMSVGQVIEMIEGPIALTLCSGGSTQICDSQQDCGIHPHMVMINRLIRSCLMQVSLQSLVSPLKKVPNNQEMQQFWQQFFAVDGQKRVEDGFSR